MSCDTGQNLYLTGEIIKDYACRATGDTGSEVAATQTYLLDHDVAAQDPNNAAFDVEAAFQLRCRNFGEWSPEVDVFSAPRADDPCGSFERKKFGCVRKHEAWSVTFDWPQGIRGAQADPHVAPNAYDLTRLVGAEGIFRRYQSDGSYYEGYGKITKCSGLPDGDPTEETTGTLMVCWSGGQYNFGSGAEANPRFVPPAAIA